MPFLMPPTLGQAYHEPTGLSHNSVAPQWQSLASLLKASGIPPWPSLWPIHGFLVGKLPQSSMPLLVSSSMKLGTREVMAVELLMTGELFKEIGQRC